MNDASIETLIQEHALLSEKSENLTLEERVRLEQIRCVLDQRVDEDFDIGRDPTPVQESYPAVDQLEWLTPEVRSRMYSEPEFTDARGSQYFVRREVDRESGVLIFRLKCIPVGQDAIDMAVAVGLDPGWQEEQRRIFQRKKVATMGIEVRCVPAGWQHPKDADGDYIPMHEFFTYTKDEIEEGLSDGWLRNEPPYYGLSVMPDWPKEIRTQFVMYESTTEGTPLSPLCSTKERLAEWMVQHNGALTQAEWLKFIEDDLIRRETWRVPEVKNAGR